MISVSTLLRAKTMALCPAARKGTVRRTVSRGADLLLSTRGLDGVDEFEPAEGVLHARAGTELEAVRATARAEGWELAMDPPGEGSTLGGVIASAAIGPRYTGFGPVRDSVLGLDPNAPTEERV